MKKKGCCHNLKLENLISKTREFDKIFNKCRQKLEKQRYGEADNN